MRLSPVGCPGLTLHRRAQKWAASQHWAFRNVPGRSGPAGVKCPPKSGGGKSGQEGHRTPSEGPAPQPSRAPGPPSPTLPTSQVGAPVSHGDHHFGGRNLLEAALDGASVPGHDSLRQADHNLGRKPGWVAECRDPVLPFLRSRGRTKAPWPCDLLAWGMAGLDPSLAGRPHGASCLSQHGAGSTSGLKSHGGRGCTEDSGSPDSYDRFSIRQLG